MVDVLRVLEDGWVFSQLAPLTTEEFVRAAAGRGYDLKAQHLGVLARSGLLVPALAIVDGPARSPVVRTNAQLLGSSTTRRSLDEAAAQGRIIDPPRSCLACAEPLITTPTTEAPPDARRRTCTAQGLLAAEDGSIAGYETDPATTVKGWRQSVAIHRTLQRHNQRDPIEHWTAPDADHALEQAWPLIDAPDPATAAAVVRRWMLGYQKPWPFTQADVSTFIGPLRHALDDVRAVWGTRHL